MWVDSLNLYPPFPLCSKHAGAAARRTLLVPKENGQVIPSGQFDSTSQYKEQFAGATGSVTMPFKPQDAMSMGSQAPDNLDTYATEYGNQYQNSPTGPKRESFVLVEDGDTGWVQRCPKLLL